MVYHQSAVGTLDGHDLIYVYTQGALMGAPEGTPFPADERQPGQTVADLIAVRTRASAAGAWGRSRLGPTPTGSPGLLT